MIKILTYIFLLTFACRVGYTQTRETIDSLQFLLTNAKEDTSQINAQIGLCFVYRLGNTDSSLFYGQQALDASQKINYLPGEILALSFMAITMEQMGNLPKALEMAFRALQIVKTNDLENLNGGALNAIGETYIILKDYPKALHYLRLQKASAENRKSEEGLAYSQYDIGNAFYEMNRLDSAYYYEQQAIKHFHNYNREEPLAYRTLGNIEMKLGNLKDALHYYQKCLQISIKNNERRATASAYNKIAAFYQNVDRPDSAVYYAKKGLEESRLIDQKQTIFEAAALLSTLYEPKDTKESLRYLKIADAFKDSLYSTGNLQAVQTLVTREEERQKEIEDAKINYQNKIKQYALFSGLGILFLIAFILYRNNRQKQKANKILQSQKEEIEVQKKNVEETLSELKSTQAQLVHSEKMASLGELTAGIAHEIKNPLNFVNNFSEVSTDLITEMLEEADKGNTEEVKAIAGDLKQNLEKITHHGKRADSIVKGMLLHSRGTAGEKAPTDINDLLEQYVNLAYHGMRAQNKDFNITIERDYDKTLEKVNVVPQDISRVFLNIINNGCYAANDRKKNVGNDFSPAIKVSTKYLKDKVEIRIADNGNGVPDKIKDKLFQPFFTTKPTGEGTGLGLSLSYDIVVKQHGGEIKIESKEGEGAEFVIILPYS